MTLYIVCMPNKSGIHMINDDVGHSYIGYILINGGAVKIMQANTMADVNAYFESKNFDKMEWRIPKEPRYQMIRVKEWWT